MAHGPVLVVENFKTRLIELHPTPIARAVAGLFHRRIVSVAIEHIINDKGRVIAERALIAK